MPGARDHRKELASFVRGLYERRGNAESLVDEAEASELRHSADESVNESLHPKLPNERLDRARTALDKVLEGREDELSVEELGGLEAVVSRQECPTIGIFEDQLVDPPGGRWARLADDQAWMKPAIRAAGRLDCRSLEVPFAGTAFLAGEGLAITNRHVALIVAQGLGRKGIELLLETELDHRREQRAPFARDFVQVRGVRMIHPYWDFAVLDVEPSGGRTPVMLASAPPSDLLGRSIAVVGYPSVGHAANAYEDEILTFNFGKDRGAWKRLQPGRVMPDADWLSTDRRFPTVRALTHDASTLGGNSGSLVLDLDGRVVIGVHFAGTKYKANFCVPTWKLYTDERVRALGLSFQGSPGGTPPADEAVERAWHALEGVVRSAVPGSATNLEPTGATEAAANPAPIRDWFERAGMDDITVMLNDTAGATKIEAQIGREQRVLLEKAAPSAGQEAVAPDPDLPEIILVHGLLGGHLDDVGAAARRVWLSPWTFVRRRLEEELALAQGGEDELDPTRRLAPTGPIQAIYRLASTVWRRAGFVVHDFGFDWRKRIELAADRLHHKIEELAAGRRRKFAIVGHSLGGLVACAYAQRHPEWHERIQRAVFLGAPLRGTFSPLEAALGVHPLQTKLELLGLVNVHDMSKTMRSFPGLFQLLPDPSVFDVEDLFRSQAWPSNARLPQSMLDEARNTKSLLRDSPLLARTAVVASIRRRTIDSIVPSGPASPALALGPRTGLGDGTAPARSVLVDGLPAALVEEDHVLLPISSDVQRAVDAMLRGGAFPADLAARPTATELEARLPAPPTAPGHNEGLLSGSFELAQRRLEQGLDWPLLRWLLESEVNPLPEAG